MAALRRWAATLLATVGITGGGWAAIDHATSKPAVPDPSPARHAPRLHVDQLDARLRTLMGDERALREALTHTRQRLHVRISAEEAALQAQRHQLQAAARALRAEASMLAAERQQLLVARATMQPAPPTHHATTGASTSTAPSHHARTGASSVGHQGDDDGSGDDD